MGIDRPDKHAVAEARNKKRQIFQSRWNAFLKNPVLTILLVFYALSHGVFAAVSGVIIGEAALAAEILYTGYPAWYNLAIFGLQILLSLPGIIGCVGLFMLKRHGVWLPEKQPDIRGQKLLRGANLAVSIAGGLALGLYPTVILSLGEILPEKAVLTVFYLFVAVTAVFLVSVALVRPVLRKLEENILCCWADPGFLLPLILVLPLMTVVVLACVPMKILLMPAVAAVCAATEGILIAYWLFIRITAQEYEKIDNEITALLQDPNDPYNPYNG